MAEALLGLGSTGAASLNQELIDKLKAAERKATVEPIETNVTNIEKDIETFGIFDETVNLLLESIKPFDLFITNGVNAFEEKSASTTGDSVVFDAADTKALNNGFTTVEVLQIGQKDVFQSNPLKSTDIYTDGTSNQFTTDESMTITMGDGTSFNFSTTYTEDVDGVATTKYYTYEELAKNINDEAGISASLEKVSDSEYRLIIKSEDVGSANSLTFSGTLAATLGYTGQAKDVDGNLLYEADGTTPVTNHILSAQDMKMTVDGVLYEASSNEINVDGLSITATQKGISTINIKNDTSILQDQVQTFVDAYNALVDIVNETTAADSSMYNKSGLKAILEQVKGKMLNTYGENDDKAVFNYGIELNADYSGKLVFDSTAFNKAVEEDFDGLKELFIGTASDKGFGTQLKELLDQMNYSNGMVSSFENSLLARQTTLGEELKKAEDELDEKYQRLTDQFAAYASIITQFETAFGGLKMMIDQSIAGN